MREFPHAHIYETCSFRNRLASVMGDHALNIVRVCGGESSGLHGVDDSAVS